MGAAIHLVARQVVEVIGADRLECEALAVRTGEAGAMLVRAIECGLDRAEVPGQRLRLRRLELDLGALEPGRWEEQLAERIQAVLAGEIAGSVRRGEAERVGATEAALLLLEEFARLGRLPWWCGPTDSPKGALAVIADEGCLAGTIRALLQSPAAIERFVNQFDDGELLLLVRLARPVLAGDPVAFRRALAAAADPDPAPGTSGTRPIPLTIWREALAEAASTGRPTDRSDETGTEPPQRELEQFIAAVRARLGFGSGIPGNRGELPSRPPPPAGARAETGRRLSAQALRMLAKAIESGPEQAGAGRAGALAIASTIARLIDGLGGEQRLRALAILERVADPGALGRLIAMLPDMGLRPPPDAGNTEGELDRPPRPAADEHDCIAVGSSGLAIAWPFLALFFESLGLVEEGKFVTGSEQHRAVSLLHYLATGEGACPEQELVLPKLFAGIGIDEVHEPGEPLGPEETASADALLDAILGHAPMLGKISRDSFRRSFLARTGSLTTRDGQWLLRVERQGIDVLLDRLPWSFAWVRLPWMAEALRVEW